MNQLQQMLTFQLHLIHGDLKDVQLMMKYLHHSLVTMLTLMNAALGQMPVCVPNELMVSQSVLKYIS